MLEIAIHARGLAKAYRTGQAESPVLRGVDLQVPAGECVFLVGPSGSGKSTLLSILGCVLTADSGELRLFGEDVTNLTPGEQAHYRLRQIGFVFQRFHLFDRLSAWENVRVVDELLGRSKPESRRRALELLDLVGLADRADHRVTQLSMGQRQRVALARALAADPPLVLADEPTASLDAESGQNAMRILKRLCRDLGKTVLVVTHDNRIFSQADRILTMADGRIRPERVAPPHSNRSTPQLAVDVAELTACLTAATGN
ncbi:MAG: ABC transporter ATP-binding protein [Planctomycetaceae bacterium]|nr:ABC transporter ATP-binding protein [Planctomycetaceae bacterium]